MLDMTLPLRQTPAAAVLQPEPSRSSALAKSAKRTALPIAPSERTARLEEHPNTLPKRNSRDSGTVVEGDQAITGDTVRSWSPGSPSRTLVARLPTPSESSPTDVARSSPIPETLRPMNEWTPINKPRVPRPIENYTKEEMEAAEILLAMSRGEYSFPRATTTAKARELSQSRKSRSVEPKFENQITVDEDADQHEAENTIAQTDDDSIRVVTPAKSLATTRPSPKKRSAGFPATSDGPEMSPCPCRWCNNILQSAKTIKEHAAAAYIEEHGREVDEKNKCWNCKRGPCIKVPDMKACARCKRMKEKCSVDRPEKRKRDRTVSGSSSHRTADGDGEGGEGSKTKKLRAE